MWLKRFLNIGIAIKPGRKHGDTDAFHLKHLAPRSPKSRDKHRYPYLSVVKTCSRFLHFHPCLFLVAFQYLLT